MTFEEFMGTLSKDWKSKMDDDEFAVCSQMYNTIIGMERHADAMFKKHNIPDYYIATNYKDLDFLMESFKSTMLDIINNNNVPRGTYKIKEHTYGK